MKAANLSLLCVLQSSQCKNWIFPAKQFWWVQNVKYCVLSADKCKGKSQGAHEQKAHPAAGAYFWFP